MPAVHLAPDPRRRAQGAYCGAQECGL